MKRAVKVLSGVLAACLVGVSLAGCSAAKDEPTTQITTNESTEAPADEATEAPADEATEVPADTTAKKSITLGIDQLVTHQALDASCQGFIDGLKDAGYVEGENLTIDFNNADGDKGNAQTIAAKLVNSESDIILAIATDAAQACANATRDIPVFITAVTDPQSAGIVESNEVPGGNVTGTSDLTPVKRQMELLVKLLPNAKTVGVIYNSSEVNSEIQGNMAVAEAEALGLTATVATASQTSEIQSV
ncbi:MAG: ABC transporter substrate-binding protein, partial [Clostridiales bacterium]|nr:ABC transporter substrate-binding protein [Clostridiales bacterium]